MRPLGSWQPPGRKTAYPHPRPLKPGPRWHDLVARGIILEGQPWRGQDASYWVRLDGSLTCWTWGTIRCHKWG